jgi:hypothetical protein
VSHLVTSDEGTLQGASQDLPPLKLELPIAAALLSRAPSDDQTKGGLLSQVVLPTVTKGSPTSYYKRIASSTQLDVLCR